MQWFWPYISFKQIILYVDFEAKMNTIRGVLKVLFRILCKEITLCWAHRHTHTQARVHARTHTHTHTHTHVRTYIKTYAYRCISLSCVSWKIIIYIVILTFMFVLRKWNYHLSLQTKYSCTVNAWFFLTYWLYVLLFVNILRFIHSLSIRKNNKKRNVLIY